MSESKPKPQYRCAACHTVWEMIEVTDPIPEIISCQNFWCYGPAKRTDLWTHRTHKKQPVGRL